MKNFFKPFMKDEPEKKEHKTQRVDTMSLADLQKMGTDSEKIEDPTTVFSDEFTFVPSEIDKKDNKSEKKDKENKSKSKSKDGKTGPNIQKTTYYPVKPIVVDKKLTIILIEDTATVAKESEIAFKLLQNHLNPDVVKIIYYGKEFKETEISRRFDFEKVKFECTEESGNEICLYDTLKYVGYMIDECYMKEVGTEYRKERINQITIMGIGTCKDTCSGTSKEEAIESFCKAMKKSGAMTKYFCLTEDSFLEAAEIGFRSIGSIA